MDKDFSKMYEVAYNHFQNAYAPYSNFRVGACVLLKNGEMIGGCNVENASYGLCICAERNALFQMVAKGYKKEDVVSLLVLTDTARPGSPCGECRQVMSELMDKNCKVYLTNLNKDLLVKTVEELLPYAFEESDLNV